MNLSSKIALVTGAARGIGRGCALELARAGAEIMINDLRDSPAAAATIEQIAALGRRVHFVAADVFQRAGCQQVLDETLRQFGRVDILVSNPAYSRRAPFLEYDPDVFEQTLRGTLIGNFHMSQLVARHLVQRGGGGKIVFISSVHHRIPFVNSVAYNAGKSGLINMARTIATELLPHRINVNVIEPGWIDTPGEHETFGDALLREAGSQLPWGRLGTIEDIGKAAAFLSSSDADYVTGTSLLVDGGLFLRAADDPNERRSSDLPTTY